MYSYNSHLLRELNHRSIGTFDNVGFSRKVSGLLYQHITPSSIWDPSYTNHQCQYGGIFNFDFSPDGKLLVAACENKSILMFDPLNFKLLLGKEEAHSDCVNCVKFLDSRLFATCSDDYTVCLWDARFMKNKIRTLTGHSNWVKNIEYCSDKEMLVTSGFDGSIYAWDINKYSETECIYQQVFHTSGLMRTKLTPDGNKLVVTTARGYVLVIHNLDLLNLSKDLQGFEYRQIQTDESSVQIEYMCEHMFERKRNRIQIISDFPSCDDAEMIASLEIHPHGWCAVSRNTTSDEKSEWTCVHDIQECMVKMESTESSSAGSTSCGSLRSDLSSELPRMRKSKKRHDISTPQRDYNLTIAHQTSSQADSCSSLLSECQFSVPQTPLSDIISPHSLSNIASSINLDSYIVYNNVSRKDPNSVGYYVSLPFSSNNSDQSLASNITNSLINGFQNSSSSNFSFSQVDDDDILDSENHETPLDRLSSYDTLDSSSSDSEYFRDFQTFKKNETKIRQNKQCLLYYIEEPNVGRGFIKEVSFSADGKIICSPFSFGVRLLSFNSNCDELCDNIPDQPQKLNELSCNFSHTSYVVTAKFSPVHCLLVTGCLNGKVNFHQPKL